MRSNVEIQRIHTSRGVGTKVEEELQEREAGNERSLSEMVDLPSENAEEERGHEEAHELDLFTSNNVDREEREVVAREETESSNDDLVS